MSTSRDTKTESFLTPKQLAKRWHVTPMTLRRWRKAGKIQVHHFGRLVRFSLADIEKIEADSKA
jgi:excisionase family DNA binding protein